MDVLKHTKEQLDIVLKLQTEKQLKIKQFMSMKYRTIGLQHIAVPMEDKLDMIVQEHKRCNQKCSAIYNKLNQIRKENGFSVLINPYEK